MLEKHSLEVSVSKTCPKWKSRAGDQGVVWDCWFKKMGISNLWPVKFKKKLYQENAACHALVWEMVVTFCSFA